MNEFSPPPPVLDSARVIAYAILGDDIPFTGETSIFVDGKLLGRVPRLAICENLGEDMGPLLFHCHDDWTVLGISGGPTVEETKQRAEINYPGVSKLWVHLDTSREAALDFYDRMTNGIKCSFCGRRPFELTGLIEGDGAAICRECVEKFHGDLSESSSR